MSLHTWFNRNRDGLQQFIYVVINPLVKGMIKVGITPNMVSTIGFLGNVAAAAMMVLAAWNSGSGEIDYAMIGWAGLVIIASSLFDMLDGQVARLGNMASRFGAMYDSVLDRYSELFTLGGITYFFMNTHYDWSALITFVALVGSIMVSYVRARAEGLGIECKVGLMQRPERVVVTSLAAIATGITHGSWVLITAMGLIALLANYTAFARVAHCKRELSKARPTIIAPCLWE